MTFYVWGQSPEAKQLRTLIPMSIPKSIAGVNSADVIIFVDFADYEKEHGQFNGKHFVIMPLDPTEAQPDELPPNCEWIDFSAEDESDIGMRRLEVLYHTPSAEMATLSATA